MSNLSTTQKKPAKSARKRAKRRVSLGNNGGLFTYRLQSFWRRCVQLSATIFLRKTIFLKVTILLVAALIGGVAVLRLLFGKDAAPDTALQSTRAELTTPVMDQLEHWMDDQQAAYNQSFSVRSDLFLSTATIVSPTNTPTTSEKPTTNEASQP